MEAKYLEILNLYKSQDDFREWTLEPFIACGKTCATDGVAICFCPLFNENEYPDLTIKVQSLYEQERNKNLAISVKDLKQEMTKIPLVAESIEIEKTGECPACHGSGEVDWIYEFDGRDYEREDVCPVCDGTGEAYCSETTFTGRMIHDTENCFCQIGNSVFKTYYIQKIIETADILNEKAIILTKQTEPYQSSIFNIGRVDIYQMPTGNYDETKLIFEIKIS